MEASTATVWFSISATTTISGTIGSTFTKFDCGTLPVLSPNIIVAPTSGGGFTVGNKPPTGDFTFMITNAPAPSSTVNLVSYPCTYTLFVTYPDISKSDSSAVPSTSGLGITTSTTIETSKSTTTTTSTASANIPQAASDDGKAEKSTTARLAVGLSVARLFLVAAVCYILFKICRREKHEKQREPGKFGSGGDFATPNRGPLFATSKNAAPLPAPGSGAVSKRGTTINIDGGLDFYLLDGAGDSEIRSELKTLSYLFKDYVETTYHSPQAVGHHQVSSSILVESLSNLGIPKPAKLQIVALALGGRTRSSAIRSLLAFVIFSALDIHSRNPSLLPLEVANFLRALPHDASRSEPSQPSKVLNTWRRASAYLLNPNKQDRSPLPLPGARFESQIKSHRVSLQQFLQFFTDTRSGQNDNEHERGLEKVIRACSTLGYALFSHPCQWRYLYETEGIWGSERFTELVVMPGLERVSGSDGEGYKSRQVVDGPVTEKV